jgi:hypothetical protein
MSEPIILRKLLQAHLRDMPDGLSWETQTARENEDFDPKALPVDTPYQEVHLLLGDPSNPFKGNDGFRREVGFLQVTLRYPKTQGSGVAEAQGRLIMNRFRMGTTLSEGQVRVVVHRPPGLSAGPKEDDRFNVIVRVWFYANTEG